MSHICPFSENKILSLHAYALKQSKLMGLSVNSLKILVYEKSYKITSEEVCKLYIENNYSLPDFFKKYGMPYKTTLFILKQSGVKTRGSKEAGKIAAIKSKSTNLARYGVDHTFKVKEFDEKRKKTYMDRYGVFNPFEKGVCLSNIENSYLSKYGVSRRELASQNSKLLWASKTEEERNRWLEKSILSEQCKVLSHHTLGRSNMGSFLERRVGVALLELDIPIRTQFSIRPYRYDFLLGQDLIIEVFGDNIHANPEIYLSEDILPINKKRVKEVWERDARRISHARNHGYEVIVIWESEIKLKNTKEIIEILNLKIYENKVDQEIARNSSEI